MCVCVCVDPRIHGIFQIINYFSVYALYQWYPRYHRAFKCVYRYDYGVIMSPSRDMFTPVSLALHLWTQIESVFCSNPYKALSSTRTHT